MPSAANSANRINGTWAVSLRTAVVADPANAPDPPSERAIRLANEASRTAAASRTNPSRPPKYRASVRSLTPRRVATSAIRKSPVLRATSSATMAGAASTT